MTDAQRIWMNARNQLTRAVTSAGFPGELADVLARELKSPKAMERMTSWLYQARPRSLETVVDEMLAIRAEIEAWTAKKESEVAQAGITDWLNSRERRELDDQEESST